MAYIRYIYNPSGAVYASVVDGVRTGNKVMQKYITNFGRVIDREKGIYKNRERGIYQFSLDNGYSKVDLYGQDGYAYIGVDTDSCSHQLKRTVFAAIDDGLSPKDGCMHFKTGRVHAPVF